MRYNRGVRKEPEDLRNHAGTVGEEAKERPGSTGRLIRTVKKAFRRELSPEDKIRIAAAGDNKLEKDAP